MANRRRGEIEVELGGKLRTLCLTLGALAELEDAFAVEDLGALAGRFGEGRLAARDALKVLGAGLRGAGEDISDGEVALMTASGGAAGFARIVTDLLQVTFGTADSGEESDAGGV